MLRELKKEERTRNYGSNNNSNRYTLKELPPDSRPRERLRARGAVYLSDAELLAILLRTGSQGQTAVELAASILSASGGLRALVESSVEELAAFRGVGIAKATQIKAAIELGRRVSSLSPEERPIIRCPEDVVQLVREEMRFLDRENFRMLCLNTKNQVISNELVSVGSLNASLVHPREVFKVAITRSAAALILVHNHPSGDPHPSAEDLEVTRRLVQAGQLLGIEVLDHLIIGGCKYVSLREKNCLT